MPQVPVVTQRQVQVSSTPDARINVSTNPGQFGADVGRGLGAVGQNMAKMQAEDDATAATDTFNLASEDSRKHLYEGADAVYSQQGKNATGSHDSSKKFFEETYSRYSGELKNDSQRQAFKSLWDSRTRTNLDNVARHEAGQRKVYFDETQQANLQTNINHATNNYDKPDEVESALINADTIIRSNPGGSSEAVVFEKQANAKSEIHKSVIGRMMLDDPDGAREYYKVNKKQINGQHHEQIESGLKGNKQKKQAQDGADKILSSNMTDSEMRKAAKKGTPEVRELTSALVSQGISQRKIDRIESERKKTDAFWSSGFLENPRVENIPANLPHDAKIAALAIAKNPNVKTVFSEWSKLDTMFNEDIDAFRKEDLNNYIHTVSTSDLKAFKEKQSLDEVKARRVQTTNARAKQTFEKSLGKKIDTKDGALFMKRYQEEIDRKQSDTKRDVTPGEEIEILDRLVIDYHLPGTELFTFGREPFFAEEVRGFKLQDLTFEDVPDAERTKIIDAYKRAGKVPTEEEIVDLYTRKVIKK